MTDLGLPDIFPLTDWSFEEKWHRGKVPFSSHHIRGTGDIRMTSYCNCEHLVKMGSASFSL